MDDNGNAHREPIGRPLSARGIRAIAGREAKAAIAALAKVAGDDAAPPSDRVRAAETLLACATGQGGAPA
jgi:hypothetical protein